MSIRYNPDSHHSSDNYFPLLISLSLAIFSPFWTSFLPGNHPWILPLLLTVACYSGIYAATHNFRELLIGYSLGTLAIGLEWLRLGGDEVHWVSSLRILAFFVFYAYLLFFVFRNLLLDRIVNFRMIAAAIAGFIVLGLMGAMIVNFLMAEDPNAFQGMSADAKFQSYKVIYYTFITLTTVGFGDITPISPSAQALAVFLSIVGQSYFAIVIAIIVGKFLMYEQLNINNKHRDKS